METFKELVLEAIENVEGMRIIEEHDSYIKYQYIVSSVKWVEFHVFKDHLYYQISILNDDMTVSMPVLEKVPFKIFYDNFIASNKFKKYFLDEYFLQDFFLGE